MNAPTTDGARKEEATPIRKMVVDAGVQTEERGSPAAVKEQAS